jgi:hypothetical protein
MHTDLTSIKAVLADTSEVELYALITATNSVPPGGCLASD